MARNPTTAAGRDRCRCSQLIAYAALFFISDESVYVNAQALAVDSGITGP